MVSLLLNIPTASFSAIILGVRLRFSEFSSIFFLILVFVGTPIPHRVELNIN